MNVPAIRSALAQQGMTQKQLAESVGLSAQAVTNWLQGKDFPRPPTLLKLATTLKLTFDQLVNIDEEGRPVIAFRKKGGTKTTFDHISKAEGVGMLLKPMVPYLPEIQALRTLITSPSGDYDRLETAVLQTRARLGIGDKAALNYSHLIGEFKNCGAVLVPVLWGDKKRHENALHIRLPLEDVTFIFLNLDTRIEDFKFWMAHELAHVYTPELAGTERGEDFADAFSGALLFPKPCAEAAFLQVAQERDPAKVIQIFMQHAQRHTISLNTVYQRVCEFAKAAGKTPLAINEKHIHATRNNHRGPLISETLFDPMPPTPDLYLTVCERVFQSVFFRALRRMVREQGVGPSYVQQILAAPMHDALALHRELGH